jgi:hypothetical protein
MITPIEQKESEVFRFWEARFAVDGALTARLGGMALEGVARDRLYNNDPLAHVWALAENGASEALIGRIHTEFLTDLGERSPDGWSGKKFRMHVAGDDLITEHGLSMNTTLAKGVVATTLDATRDPRRAYGVRIDGVLSGHIPQIIDWYNCGNSDIACFASLCPPGHELDGESAKVNSYNTDRQLASVWMYESTTHGLEMHPFSLDNCTLERLQRLVMVLGSHHVVADTTIAELGNMIRLPAGVSTGAILDAWATILQEDGLKSSVSGSRGNAESRPDAFALYMRFLASITESLNDGAVSRELGRLLAGSNMLGSAKLPMGFGLMCGSKITTRDAREIMEFVQSKMIPHSVYGDGSVASVGMVYGSDGSSILAATGAAIESKITYDNACPGSDFSSVAAETAALAGSGMIGRQVVVDNIAETKRPGSCVSCGAGPTVVGCGFCPSCNGIWGKEYVKSGKGLSIAEVSKIAAKYCGNKGSTEKYATSAISARKRVPIISLGWFMFVDKNDPKFTTK